MLPPEQAQRPEPGSPVDWLRYARSDLALAEGTPRPEVIIETLCFHAQEVAEKACKAVLFHLGTPPPRTHDLTRIFELLRQQLPVPAEVEGAEELTLYAVVARYPADLGKVEEAEWREAVRLARRVVAWANS